MTSTAMCMLIMCKCAYLYIRGAAADNSRVIKLLPFSSRDFGHSGSPLLPWRSHSPISDNLLEDNEYVYDCLYTCVQHIALLKKMLSPGGIISGPTDLRHSLDVIRCNRRLIISPRTNDQKHWPRHPDAMRLSWNLKVIFTIRSLSGRTPPV